MKKRCSWATKDPLYVHYHDEEWGEPLHDDRRLFEFLVLEGAQAGLSWITILRKRENYRRALDGFDPERVAAYRSADLRRLLDDPGLVRNRLKLESAVSNAKAFLIVRREFGSFDRFVWSFVGGEPMQNDRRRLDQVPAETPEAAALSRALRRRGFRFVGPTICYAFMQAVGMVNDHLTDCFRYGELGGCPASGIGRPGRSRPGSR